MGLAGKAHSGRCLAVLASPVWNLPAGQVPFQENPGLQALESLEVIGMANRQPDPSACILSQNEEAHRLVRASGLLPACVRLLSGEAAPASQRAVPSLCDKYWVRCIRNG